MARAKNQQSQNEQTLENVKQQSPEQTSNIQDVAKNQQSQNEQTGAGDSNVPLDESVKVIMKVGEQPANNNLVVHTVNVVTAPAKHVHQSLTRVKIKYPEDWTKEKFFKDGDIKHVSKETAKTFVEIGIGTILND